MVVGCAGSKTRESTGEYLDDTAVTTKVKSALLRDEVVKGLDIQVETFKGTVQLSGFVNTASEKQRAEAIARDVAGVRSVKNDIRVMQ
ncbi:MAG: BON domain-containing protein [Methylocaldum sp.]|nr:BON domain-containing protein [Methylocaldum sp.]